jgi:uncharacterized protein (DUF305 family)
MRISSALVGPLASLAALALAACGAGSTAIPAAAPTDTSAATAMPSTMPGMDHGTMAPTTMPSDMAGMDHGVVSAEGQPYDATFIDGMIAHHEGAITMANQALQQAEHQEIKDLAQAIVSAQEQEIGKMKEWRTSWYPDLPETTGMDMDIGPMEVAAGDTPFDQRFIQAMIPHHEGAIAMARDAQTKAEHQEIKALAEAIITAQDGEIAQMRQWLKDWYGISQ